MTGPGMAAAARTADLRLARLHLRTGALGLARAELESFVGSGDLDAAGLVDLAEARWRTGDLAGAGDAAIASLEQGAEDPMALVIAAEATVAAGQAMRALELAERARAILTIDLDDLFAGMPQSAIWPIDAGPSASGVPSTVPTGPATTEPREGWARASRDQAEPWRPAATAETAVVRLDVADEPDAEIAAATAEIAAGAVDRAGLRLALVVRLAPARSDAVVALLAGRPEPGLLLALGDAHRASGDEPAAQAAWTAAITALTANPGPADPPARRSGNAEPPKEPM